MLAKNSKIAYNRGVIIRAANSESQQFFLLSQLNTAIIIIARLVIESTVKTVESLAAHSITQRAFFIGPHTTKKRPLQSANSRPFFSGDN